MTHYHLPHPLIDVAISLLVPGCTQASYAVFGLCGPLCRPRCPLLCYPGLLIGVSSQHIDLVFFTNLIPHSFLQAYGRRLPPASNTCAAWIRSLDYFASTCRCMGRARSCCDCPSYPRGLCKACRGILFSIYIYMYVFFFVCIYIFIYLCIYVWMDV